MNQKDYLEYNSNNANEIQFKSLFHISPMQNWSVFAMIWMLVSLQNSFIET